jgi:hypothetical protein
MDDIARDVVQRQAHNEDVVAAPGPETTTPRFPWDDLDRGIQEQILQDAPPHSRRYFTNPRGGFNWAELERGVRAQIVRHALPRVHVQTHGEDYLERFDASGTWSVPTILDLTVVGRGVEQAWHALWPAPTLLQVTFSKRLDREQLEWEWFEAEDDQARGRGFYDFPPRRTGPQLAELQAQMQRTYSWTDVRAIRLIRHVRHPDVLVADYYTFQIVRRGEHGDEVIEAPESFELSRTQRDELERQLSTRLGMRYRVMRELGFRIWPDDDYEYYVYDRERANGEMPNGIEWSVLPVPAGSGFRELLLTELLPRSE